MKKPEIPLISMKQLSRIMTALYVVLFIPLVVISFYSFPSSDDFSMTLLAHQAFEETGSVISAFAACVSKTWTLYLTWIGYFTSSLLTTISPAVFNIHWYGLGAVLVFAGLHAAVIFFLYVVMERLFGIDRYTRRCVTIAILTLMIQMMPETENRVESFYWYSGAGNYTLTFSIMLLYLSCMLLAIYGKTEHRKQILVLACVCGFFAGGANYMSALTGAILTVVLGVLVILNRCGVLRRWIAGEEPPGRAASHILLTGCRNRSLFVPMLFMLTGFVLNIAAPGNSVRAIQTGGFGALKSIVLSLYYTLDLLLDEYLNWAILIMFAVLGVFFWYMTGCQDRAVSSSLRLSFRHPVVIILFAYGIVSANITPLLYATGNTGSGRNLGLFWMQFVLSAALCEWYLIGWLRRKLYGTVSETSASENNGPPDEAPAAEHDGIYNKTSVSNNIVSHDKDAETKERLLPAGLLRVAAFLTVLLLGGSVMCVMADPDYYTFTSALDDLLDGTAQTYAEENEARLALLEDNSEEDIVLVQHTAKPALIYFSDISIGDEGWDNFTMNRYFGKNSVTGVSAETVEQ